MLVYRSNYEYTKPFNVVFLCGSKYNQDNPRDKRIVLKKYIESTYNNCLPVILEDNFKFGKNTQEKLSYDDIFLKDLGSIEQLTSLFVDKIIVIHETISTAAEIGMFAIDSVSAEKLCILYPDTISSDEDIIGSFIKLAFLKKQATNKIQKIVYYPDIEVNRLSSEKSDYYYFFHEDKIGEKLGLSINEFLNFSNDKQKIKFLKKPYGKISRSSQIINYSILANDQRVDVFVHASALMIQLISLMFLPEVKKELRKEKTIQMHVSMIFDTYCEIIKSTICSLAKENIESFNFNIGLKGTFVDIKSAIGFFLYLLQAVNFIKLTQSAAGKHNSIRKFQFTGKFDQIKTYLGDYIFDLGTSAYGELGL